jgi:hypothetical protein
MTTDQIRQAIAESGKSRISDVVNYFKAKFPAAFILGTVTERRIRAEARDLLKHLK